MTIPSTARKAGPLLGTGVQTAWPFAFKVFSDSDILVAIADSDGVETPVTLNTDYSVALNANQDTSPGGTVTYPLTGSPLATGSVLSIVGDIDYDQPLDLPSGGNFSPTALENELDRLAMQIQQLREILTRALLAPVTSGASGQLPAPEANALIGWSDASTLQNVPISDLVTAGTYGLTRNDIVTGDGATVLFSLSEDPVVLSNLLVSVDGLVLVPGVDYQLVGGAVMFTVAPSLGAEVLVRYGQALITTGGMASTTVFTPAGGLSSLNVQDALEELDSEKVAASAIANMLETSDIGASVQAYDVDTAKTDVVQTWTTSQRTNETTDNDGSFDLNAAIDFKCTPAAGFTLTFTNIPTTPVVQKGTVMLINPSAYAVAAHANTKLGAATLAALSAAGTYELAYRTSNGVAYVTASGALA
jgi:hypothetical protein